MEKLELLLNQAKMDFGEMKAGKKVAVIRFRKTLMAIKAECQVLRDSALEDKKKMPVKPRKVKEAKKDEESVINEEAKK